MDRYWFMDQGQLLERRFLGLVEGEIGLMCYGLMFAIDKAPRLTIRRVIWILASDTVFVNSTNISTNIETAMLSSLRLTFARLTPLI